MYISRLRISHFRGIEKATVHLGPNTVLVGANNVGKTALVEALALLFGRGQLVKGLSDYDFFGGKPSPTSRIEIKAIITGFANNDPGNEQEIFNMRRAVPVWWKGATREVSYGEKPQDASLAVEIGFAARLDPDSLEPEVVRYFVEGDADPFLEDEVHTIPESFRQRLGVFVLPASRTWEHMLTFRSELFRRLLKYQDAFPVESINQLRDWLREPSSRPEQEQGLAPITKRANNELAAFIGEAESDFRLRPTTGDIAGVLYSMTSFLKGKSGLQVPLSSHGSGVVSLQTLLLLLEFGRARKEKGENFILIAEEPELHLHPGHHRRLVARMRGVCDQTIVTTHSPTVAAYHRPSELSILRNRSGSLECATLQSALDGHEMTNASMRLTTVYRADACEALMHRIVLLPEGQTEFLWFRHLIREAITAEGWIIPEDAESVSAIGVIPTPDAQVVALFQRLSPLVDELIPIVDGDAAGKDYVKKLLELISPPRLIVRLSDGLALESLITWVLCGLGGTVPGDILGLLALPVGSGSNEVARALAGPFKSRYDVHESLSGFVGITPAAAHRARVFMQGIAQIAASSTPRDAGWVKDVMTSTVNSMVWIFNPNAAS